MIQPERGLPKMPASGMADMNIATTRARRRDGNQRVR
jgi:hypothetical protein